MPGSPTVLTFQWLTDPSKVDAAEPVNLCGAVDLSYY